MDELNTVTGGAGFMFACGFSCSALLYLVTAELLADMHASEAGESMMVTSQFFLGFASVLVLNRIAP
jgi:hypothetical protein